MVCKFCGSDIVDGSRFCLFCGMPVDFNEAEEEKFSKETEKREILKLRARKMDRLISIILPIICVLVLFSFGYILFYSSNKIDLKVHLEEDVNVRNLENLNSSIYEKPRVYVGGSFESQSYIVSFKDIIIVDKSSDNAGFYTISTGKEYVLLHLIIDNLTYSDVVYSPITNFKSYLDGHLIDYSRMGILAEGLTSIEGLNKRKSSRDGYLAYYVSEGWTELRIDIGIDGLENEPILYIENPKNRNISDEELENIWETYEISDFLYETNQSYLDDDTINACIIEFMHENCLDRNDYIPIKKLHEEINKLN